MTDLYNLKCNRCGRLIKNVLLCQAKCPRCKEEFDLMVLEFIRVEKIEMMEHILTKMFFYTKRCERTDCSYCSKNNMCVYSKITILDNKKEIMRPATYQEIRAYINVMTNENQKKRILKKFGGKMR